MSLRTTLGPLRPRGYDPVSENSPSRPPGSDAIYAARGRYSFASDGGAQGAIGLMGGLLIPLGAVIIGGYAEVVTVPVGAGASLAVHVEAANDIITAAAISGAPWSTVGLKSVIPVFTGATMKRTTAARDITLTISAADLTAGVIDVVLFYIKTV